MDEAQDLIEAAESLRESLEHIGVGANDAQDAGANLIEAVEEIVKAGATMPALLSIVLWLINVGKEIEWPTRRSVKELQSDARIAHTQGKPKKAARLRRKAARRS